jgi:hypothetical protein
LQNGRWVSEENCFPFQFSISASIDELRPIVELEGILNDCTGTRDAVARCCVAFREADRFEAPISFCKIGPLLGIDAKTAWGYWNKFKQFGLSDGESGRPRLLCAAQMDAVVDFALAEFHAQHPPSCNRLLWFVRSEFHADLLPDSLRRMLRRDPRLKAVIGQPMELQRVQVSRDTILEYFERRKQVLKGVPCRHRRVPLSSGPIRGLFYERGRTCGRSDEANVPVWLQILDQEAALLLGEDQE